MDDAPDIVGEVVSELGQTAKHTGSTLFGEVKKLGKTAVSHITGNPQQPTSQETRKEHLAHLSRFSVLGELKKFGQSAASQLAGRPLNAREITEMAQRDKYLSKQDADAVREKILRIYREYEEKRKKKRQKEWQYHVQEQQQKKEEALLKKREERKIINPQIAKSKAEIGKNWGAE